MNPEEGNLSDDDLDTLPPAPARRKHEWRIGNILEAALTYAFPMVYTAVMLFWIFLIPDAIAAHEQVGAFRVFFLLTIVTISLYAYGCLVGSEARFSAKPHRILIGGAAALSPGLVPILMWARSGPAPDAYHAAGMDAEFGGYVIAVMVPLGLAFLKMYTAVRRVKEVTGEH